MLKQKSGNMPNIIVVEDDIEIANLLNTILVKENYKPQIYNAGNDFLENLPIDKPDLLILDILLPGMSGLEICKHLKINKDYKAVPIIALTVRNQNYDIVTGLNIGFDDYITKPFDKNILIAKIKAILRKEAYLKEESLVLELNDDFILDKGSQSLNISDEKIELTTFEFKTLCLLVENKNKVISRNKIIDAIRGEEADSFDRSVDKLINRLRKKMRWYSKNIISVYGAGYCFKYRIKDLPIDGSRAN